MGTRTKTTVDRDLIQRRAAARGQARVVAGLIIEEVGRIPSSAQPAFWDELKKLLPIPNSPPAPTPRDVPLTDVQARVFGRSVISFGKYAGISIDEIPLDYLEHLCEPSPFILMLRRYLDSNRITAEFEEQ